MSGGVTPPPSALPQGRQARSSPADIAPTAAPTAGAIDERSDSEAAHPLPLRGRRGRKILRISAVVAGVLVGVGVHQQLAPVYRGAATFSTTPATGEFAEVCRQDLVRFAWQAGSASSGAITRWEVSPEGPLRLELEGPSRDTLDAELSRIAAGFVARVRADWQRRLEVPSQAERVVVEQLADLDKHRRSVNDARSEADAQWTNKSALDARDRAQQDVAGGYRQLTEIRTALVNRHQELHALKHSPVPLKGWVSPERREAERLADLDLQQDLAALRIHVAAVRRQLLDVWQRSSPALDDLLAAAGKLRRVYLGAIVREATGPTRWIVDESMDEAGAYHDRLSAFARGWNSVFVALQRLKIDPTNDAVLDSYAAAHRWLGDFRFEAGGLVDGLEIAVRALNNEVDDAARHYKMRSEFVGAVKHLESAQASFFRLADQVNEAENFRLDQALRSARGLRGRVYRRWLAIESRLDSEALAQAIQDRQRLIAEAESRLASALQDLDRSIGEVLANGDRLDASINQADAQLRAQVLAEQRAEWLAMADGLIAGWEQRLQQLRVQRRQAAPQATIELAGRSVGDRSIHPTRRLGLGILAGLAAALFVLGAQKWLLDPLGKPRG